MDFLIFLLAIFVAFSQLLLILFFILSSNMRLPSPRAPFLLSNLLRKVIVHFGILTQQKSFLDCRCIELPQGLCYNFDCADSSLVLVVIILNDFRCDSCLPACIARLFLDIDTITVVPLCLLKAIKGILCLPFRTFKCSVSADHDHFAELVAVSIVSLPECALLLCNNKDGCGSCSRHIVVGERMSGYRCSEACVAREQED